MMNNFTIGLNETQLGIVAPPWFVASMKNVIGTRQTELALTTGNLFTTEEALKVGMIDEIASSKEDGIARAEKFCGRFARIPPVARVKSKLGVRGADIEVSLISTLRYVIMINSCTSNHWRPARMWGNPGSPE